MGFISLLKDNENKFPWTLIGTIVTMLGFIFAMYIGYGDIKPKVKYELLNQTDLVDLKKPLEKLKFLYNEQDIVKNKLNIRIFSIKIMNAGDKDVLQNDFDKDLEWGISIKNGSFIESRLIDSNSKYLKKSIKPIVSSKEIILFPKKIIEKNKYFIIDIMVIHKINEKPILDTIGKIAGQEELKFIYSSNNGENIVEKLFSASLWVQIPIYIFMFFLSAVIWLAILWIILDFIPNIIEKSKIKVITNFFGYKIKYSNSNISNTKSDYTLKSAISLYERYDKRYNSKESYLASVYFNHGKKGIKKVKEEVEGDFTKSLEFLNSHFLITTKIRLKKEELANEILKLKIHLDTDVSLDKIDNIINSTKDTGNEVTIKLNKEIKKLENEYKEHKSSEQFSSLSVRRNLESSMVIAAEAYEIIKINDDAYILNPDFVKLVELFNKRIN